MNLDVAVDPKAVFEMARLELEQELFREAVEQEKRKLREKNSLWDRVFPWRIVIIRKGKSNVGCGKSQRRGRA